MQLCRSSSGEALISGSSVLKGQAQAGCKQEIEVVRSPVGASLEVKVSDLVCNLGVTQQAFFKAPPVLVEQRRNAENETDQNRSERTRRWAAARAMRVDRSSAHASSFAAV